MKVRPISQTLSGHGDVSKVMVSKDAGQGVHLRNKLLFLQCFFLIIAFKKISKRIVKLEVVQMNMHGNIFASKAFGVCCKISGV